MKLVGACTVGALLLSSPAWAQETQTYSYDVHGRLTAVTRTVGATTRTTAYTLDNADNRTQRATTVSSGGSGLVAEPHAGEAAIQSAPGAASESTVEAPASSSAGPDDGPSPMADSSPSTPSS